MSEYKVKITDTADIDWTSLPEAEIADFPWNSEFRPVSYASLAYAKTGDEREGLYAHLFSFEKDPEARYTRLNEPVYLDSCLEFFFTMHGAGKPENGYINIESNSVPAILTAYGRGRAPRTSLVDMCIAPFEVRSVVADDHWELFEFVPLTVLKKVFGIEEVDESTYFAGNFYKCGSYRHPDTYGSWAHIGTPEPDFHRPECFGRFILTRDI